VGKSPRPQPDWAWISSVQGWCGEFMTAEGDGDPGRDKE
jgi:hypothetical protein